MKKPFYKSLWFRLAYFFGGIVLLGASRTFLNFYVRLPVFAFWAIGLALMLIAVLEEQKSS